MNPETKTKPCQLKQTKGQAEPVANTGCTVTNQSLSSEERFKLKNLKMPMVGKLDQEMAKRNEVLQANKRFDPLGLKNAVDQTKSRTERQRSLRFEKLTPSARRHVFRSKKHFQELRDFGLLEADLELKTKDKEESEFEEKRREVETDAIMAREKQGVSARIKNFVRKMLAPREQVGEQAEQEGPAGQLS